MEYAEQPRSQMVLTGVDEAFCCDTRGKETRLKTRLFVGQVPFPDTILATEYYVDY